MDRRIISYRHWCIANPHGVGVVHSNGDDLESTWYSCGLPGDRFDVIQRFI